MKTITRQRAIERIYASNGVPFTCAFWKRTDGTYRTGTFRFGPQYTSKGGKRAYDHAAYGLIPVWDENKQDVRAIPMEGLDWITFGDGGEEGTIADSPDNPL